MLDRWLAELVQRMKKGDVSAFDEFADRLGLAFRGFFLDKKILPPFAERLARQAIRETSVALVITEGEAGVVGIVNAVLDELFRKWFRTFQEDVIAAGQLQAALFPKTQMESPGLRIGARSRPMDAVNGDLYDIIARIDDTLTVVVDASGKGVAAGLYSVLAGGFFRSQSRREESPADILQHLQSALGSRKTTGYLTGIVISWNPGSREIRMAAGGFEPPLISAGNERVPLKLEGLPLGMWLPSHESTSRAYDEVSIVLEPGDWIAVFSDGVIDQENQIGERYGVDRLYQMLALDVTKDAQLIVDDVFADLDRHAAPHWQGDDQTLVLMKVV